MPNALPQLFDMDTIDNYHLQQFTQECLLKLKNNDEEKKNAKLWSLRRNDILPIYTLPP